MQTQSILVVDNEPDMRKALIHSLNRSGFSAQGAASGVEGLVKFNRDNFSMVITDMKMPEMSGMEFLGEVKKISPDIPVVMITAFGTINNAVEAIKKGASDYILKPFSTETLEAVVEKVYKKSNGRTQAQTYTRACKWHKNNSGRKSEVKKFITQDERLLKTLKLARTVASSSATVLIQGESGTGKEILAAYIHQCSGCGDRPYIAVNCAALPETLAESELFGHEKGAFTGAVSKKKGKFELADSGTIILDEISETAMPLQAKLLRVLQEREIDRIGGSRPVPVNSRIIAISNVDLKKEVKDGKFRADLFYRINVIPLTIPPLREREKDIPLLAGHFLKKYSSMNSKNFTKINKETVSILLSHKWNGNVRELENTIERAVLLGEGEELLPEHLYFEELDFEEQEDIKKENMSIKAGLSVREMEKKLIFKTLKEVNDNRTHAAELLGISIRTLRNKLKEYREEMDCW